MALKRFKRQDLNMSIAQVNQTHKKCENGTKCFLIKKYEKKYLYVIFMKRKNQERKVVLGHTSRPLNILKLVRWYIVVGILLSQITMVSISL